MASKPIGINSYEMDISTINTISTSTTTRITRNTVVDHSYIDQPDNFKSSENIRYNKLSSASTINNTDHNISLNTKDYILMATYGYINVIIGVVYSCLTPFFPREAESKGLGPSVYGFLISIQEIISFVLCPLVGILLPKFGLRVTLLNSSIMSSIGVILFGATNWVPSGYPFALACGFVRAFGSIGMAGLIAGMYAAIPIFFPNNIPQVFGLLEMCYGLGMTIGPFLGGILYELGGFDLPFFVSGFLIFISFPMVYFTCPESKGHETTEGKYGLFDILSNLRIAVNLLVTLVICTVIGFSEVALEPHLREFANVKSSIVGVIFLVSGLFYGLSTWIVGMLIPKVKDATFMSIIGLTLVSISYTFIGPMYPLPISPSILLVIICQILFGMGASIGCVSNFTQAIREKDLSDMKDDSGAGSIISTLFVSIFSLGSAVGPIVGGQLTEYFTFSQASVFIVALTWTSLIMVILVMIFHKRSYIVTETITPKVIVQRLASTQHRHLHNLKKFESSKITITPQHSV